MHLVKSCTDPVAHIKSQIEQHIGRNIKLYSCLGGLAADVILLPQPDFVRALKTLGITFTPLVLWYAVGRLCGYDNEWIIEPIFLGFSGGVAVAEAVKAAVWHIFN
jgi:hypothetical protein